MLYLVKRRSAVLCSKGVKLNTNFNAQNRAPFSYTKYRIFKGYFLPIVVRRRAVAADGVSIAAGADNTRLLMGGYAGATCVRRAVRQ